MDKQITLHIGMVPMWETEVFSSNRKDSEYLCVFQAYVIVDKFYTTFEYSCSYSTLVYIISNYI